MPYISAADFNRIRSLLGEQAEEDIVWATVECGLPPDPEYFAREVIFVICNSGMGHKVARAIFDRCMAALAAGRPVLEVFKHKGKTAAIEQVWSDRVALHEKCLAAAANGDVALLEFAESLPWIGGITKYHVAKNFGAQLAKPDVHLQRLADREGCTAQALCERLASQLGLCVAAIDTVLWRACANGVINSRTGEIAS